MHVSNTISFTTARHGKAAGAFSSIVGLLAEKLHPFCTPSGSVFFGTNLPCSSTELELRMVWGVTCSRSFTQFRPLVSSWPVQLTKRLQDLCTECLELDRSST